MLLLLTAPISMAALSPVRTCRGEVVVAEVAAVSPILATAPAATETETGSASTATLVPVSARELVIVRILAWLSLLTDEPVAIDDTAVDGVHYVIRELVVDIHKREIPHDVDMTDIDLGRKLARVLVDESDDVGRANGVNLADIDEEPVHVLVAGPWAALSPLALLARLVGYVEVVGRLVILVDALELGRDELGDDILL